MKLLTGAHRRTRIRLCANSAWLSGLGFLTAFMLGTTGWLTAQVTSSGTETQVNTTTANDQLHPAVAMDSFGNYLIVWESFGTDGSGYGVYGQRYSSGGMTSGGEFRINTTTGQDQRFPATAMDWSGNAVVVWMDEVKDGSGWGIYGQQYNSSGTVNGSEFVVNSTTAGHQKFPQVAIDKDGDFIVVWMDVTLNGTGYQIRAQRYAADGTATGSEIDVDNASTAYQGYPVIASDRNGAFVIAWQNASLDGAGMAIAARRFDNTGSALGSTFQVNTTTAENQQAPAIAMDSLGNFVIVWSSYGQDNDAEGIYGQRYLASAAPNGSEFQISTSTAGSQTEPHVAMNREGGFNVIWASYGQDGSRSGVYLQAYDVNGTMLNSETLVNTRTDDFQQFGALAQSKNAAEVVIAWQDGLRNSTTTHDGSNYGIYSQRYLTTENNPPLAVCQEVTVPADGNCQAVVTADQVDNGSSDPEGNTVILSLSPTGPYPLGTTQVTLTVGDGTGLTATCTANIIVVDQMAPVPDIAVLPNATSECSLTLVAPTAMDNCVGAVTATTTDPTTYTSQGTFSVTWTYDDGNGNASMQTQTVVVNDVTAPVPAMSILQDVNSECAVSLTAPTAMDNCAGMISAITGDPTSFSTQGTYQVTWIYDDGNGNTFPQSQTVIVDDVTAPVPTLASLPNVTGECSATVTAPFAMDNCIGPVTATTTDPLTYNTQGSFTVTWIYDDGNGNASQQTQTVIVNDVTAPVPDVASLPDVSGDCSVTLTAPTATDNCSGSIVAFTSDPTTYSSQGTFSVTWIYDDGNGNTSQQTQTVIVDDLTAPVPDIASLPNVTGECSATVEAPIATDNCLGAVTATTTDPLTYTTQGIFTVTWTYDDGNGNTSQQTQSVIVDDFTAPVPNVATLPDVTGECSAIVTPPTATDNCLGTVTATSTDPLTYNTQGTFTVTWTYDDGNGNTSQQTQTVIVDDVTAPVPDVASLPNATGECSVTLIAPTATDNCSGSILATTDPLTYNTQGTFTVVWTFDDGNGNTSQQIQTVIIDDLTAPVITTCPGPQIVNTDPGNCAGIVPDLTALAAATDNCGPVSLSQSPVAGSSFGGTHGDQITVTLIADDGNGNSEICNVVLTLKDEEAPVFIFCPAPVELCGEQAVFWNPPTAFDNCSSLAVSGSHAPGDVFSVGTTMVMYTAIDAGGNEAVCSFDVTIHALPEVSTSQSEVPDFCQGLAVLTATVSNEADLLLPLTYSWSNGLRSESSVIVMDNNTYTVTVADSRGCAQSESHAVSLIASDVTSAYTLIAKKEIKLKNSSLSSGGAGVMDAGKKARFESGSVVSTFAKAPVIILNGGSTVATQIIGQVNLTLPPFRANPSPTNNDITVQPGQTLTLNGNSYGKIEVGKNATLLLDNSEIFIKKLRVLEDASVEFLQATELIIDETVELKKNTFFNLTGEPVVVYIEKDFKVKEGSTVFASIYAQKKIVAEKAKSNNQTIMTGLFISMDKINSKEYVDWNANYNCGGNLTPSANPLARTTANPGSEIDWKVYPNPASSLVTVELPAFGEEVEVILYDLNGKRVWNQTVQSGQTELKFDVSSNFFKSTIYFVHVVGENLNLTKRLVVMK